MTHTLHPSSTDQTICILANNRSLPSSSSAVIKLSDEQQRIQGRLADIELYSTVQNGIETVTLEDRKPEPPNNDEDMTDEPSEPQTPVNGAGNPNGTRVETKPAEAQQQQTTDPGADTNGDTVFVSRTILAKQKALAAWVSTIQPCLNLG